MHVDTPPPVPLASPTTKSLVGTISEGSLLLLKHFSKMTPSGEQKRGPLLLGQL